MGKDFTNADKGRKFSKGGDTMATKMGMFEKSGKDVEKRGMKEGSKKDMAMDRMQMMGMKKGGATAKYMKFSDSGKPSGMAAAKKMATGGFTRAADGIAKKGKTKGTMIKMNKGGMSC